MAEEKGSVQVIRYLGLLMFWAVWVYGFVCIGVLARYKEALVAGYGVITGRSEAMIER